MPVPALDPDGPLGLLGKVFIRMLADVLSWP
jgi:hypothetical protein